MDAAPFLESCQRPVSLIREWICPIPVAVVLNVVCFLRGAGANPINGYPGSSGKENAGSFEGPAVYRMEEGE